MAMGTADAPIVMSGEDEGLDGSGEWGGLIIHGYGNHNECPAEPGPCNIDSEGNLALPVDMTPRQQRHFAVCRRC